MIEEAKKYLDLGYNVIPVSKDKRPLIKWEIYQKEKVSIEQVEGWFKQFKQANIGIVTGNISNLFVIDTDTEEATQKIQDYIPENIITPIQTTPRGGKHFFFQHLEGYSNRARVLPGVDIRTQGGYIVVCPSQNGDGKHWQWLEGLSLFDVSPAPVPDSLIWFIKEFAFVLYKGRRQIDDNSKKTTNDDNRMFIEGRRDEDIFHTAHCLIQGGMTFDEAYQVIEIIANNCFPPFPLSEAKVKVHSALQRADRKNRNLSDEIKNWILSSSGVFLSSDVVRSLHLSSRDDEKHVSTVLRRLKEDGLIEKYGEKRGCFRIVETDVEEIDFMGTDEKIIDIKWPFEIEKWVKILPKNIVVIAGETNAGKTAFLLNTCFMNMGNFRINYFSSEMGAMELRARLNKFQCNLKHWKDNINFRERSSNFADVIKPDEVNIIDFLEITDEFYKVGGMIKEIYDKLKKGIAIIALQKNKGRDEGLGAERSVEKARLYLSMQPHKIKILKGKNWANQEINPNGMEWNFKLVQGAKFIITEEQEIKRKDW